ncbi:alpha/beta hydrolase [Candidatus Bipolaricaulota bacterium]|nr:alpha/beta hydrolase [Candidatus Bipolaricaulota bacterium]
MKKQDFSFYGKDGHELYGTKYPVINPKGAVQIIHGMAEHRKRYENFALELAKNDFSVYAYDQRGHGETARSHDLPLGHLKKDHGWDELLEDARKLTGFIESDAGGVPVFLFGHSMGSFLARNYIVEYGEKIEGVVISGSGLLNGLLLYPLHLISKLEKLIKGSQGKSFLLEKILFSSNNREFEPARTPHDWLSRNDEAVDRYIEDELAGFSCTTGFYDEFLAGMKKVKGGEAATDFPRNVKLLFVSGEKDPVGGAGDVKSLASNFREKGATSVEVKIYEEARHELLHEKNKEKVTRDIVAWLKNNCRKY